MLVSGGRAVLLVVWEVPDIAFGNSGTTGVGWSGRSLFVAPEIAYAIVRGLARWC